MLSTLKIAFRNVLRNGRRSLTIGLAITTGTLGLLCFGQFISATLMTFESTVVRNDGHISVFRKGYWDFGAGNPTAYGIDNYAAIQALIRKDPQLSPLVRHVTPRVGLYGIASNGRTQTSTTFFAIGMVPADKHAMKQWDDHHLLRLPVPHEGPDITMDDPSVAVIGAGLGRILGLCAPLAIPDCPPRPAPAPAPTGIDDAGPGVDLAALAGRENGDGGSRAPAAQIDLLTATARGAPNVGSLTVVRAEDQAVKAIDDAYVRMNFDLAQRLLFGREKPQATSLTIQLNHTQDLRRAETLLGELFARHALPLETRDFGELNPFYKQGQQFLGAIFIFISVIIGVIALFMIVNTTTMTVMEQVNEIGAARALGVQRSSIVLQYALEGSMIGAIGASLGVVLAQIVGLLVNAANLRVVFPGYSKPSDLLLLTSHEAWPMMGIVWIVLIIVASCATIMPARHGARMPVVDALRHV